MSAAASAGLATLLAYAILAGGLIHGLVYAVRNELAKRRSGRSVFPPTRTIETSDSLPF